MSDLSAVLAVILGVSGIGLKLQESLQGSNLTVVRAVGMVALHGITSFQGGLMGCFFV